MRDVGGRRRRGHHGPDAARLAQGQRVDGVQGGTVLPGSGEIGDQVVQRPDLQLGEGLGPGFADPFDIAHIGGQIAHGLHTSFPCFF